MPRQNRVDPWGDLHAVSARGLFTGNRGCLVDDDRRLARHHRGSLWITCLTDYRGWHHELDQPRVWTPLFFLDDAVALAAGHRPCGLCRRADYLAYRQAVTDGLGLSEALRAPDLNRRLQAERLHQFDRRGRGRGPWLERAPDRKLWSTPVERVPPGAVIVAGGGRAHLVTTSSLRPFAFDGWGRAAAKPARGSVVDVLTPPTSTAALLAGYRPRLHQSATGPPGSG